MYKFNQLTLFAGFILLILTSCTKEWIFSKKDGESKILEQEDNPDTIHYTYTIYIDSFEMREAEYPTVYFDPFDVSGWDLGGYENYISCHVSDMTIYDTISKTQVTFLGAYLDNSNPQFPLEYVIPPPAQDDPTIYVVDTIYENRIRGINYAVFWVEKDSVFYLDTAYYGNDNFRFYQALCHYDDMESIVEMYPGLLVEAAEEDSEKNEILNEWISSSFKVPIQFYGRNLYLLDIFAYNRELKYSYLVFYWK